jgi:hypothetical protein
MRQAMNGIERQVETKAEKLAAMVDRLKNKCHHRHVGGHRHWRHHDQDAMTPHAGETRMRCGYIGHV